MKDLAYDSKEEMSEDELRDYIAGIPEKTTVIIYFDNKERNGNDEQHTRWRS